MSQGKLLRWVGTALVAALIVSRAEGKMLPYRLDCDHGKGSTQTETVEGVIATIDPEGDSCRLSVRSAKGDVIFRHSASGLQVSAGLELDKDDEQFLIIQMDISPFELVIVRTGSHPAVVATLENEYGFWVQNDCADRRWHIWTADGGFGDDPVFAPIYHHDLLVPEVVISVRGDELSNITPQCRAYFGKRVSAVTASLSANQIDRFKWHEIKDEIKANEVKGQVLYAALTKLYIGQVKMARGTLNQMWPPSDIDQTWKWMLKKQSSGLLSKLSRSQIKA